MNPNSSGPGPSCHGCDTGPFSALSPAVSPDTADKAKPPGLLSRMLTNKMALNWIGEIMSPKLFNLESTPRCTTQNELLWAWTWLLTLSFWHFLNNFLRKNPSACKRRKKKSLSYSAILEHPVKKKKKERKKRVPKSTSNLHSIVWPTGSTKNGCNRVENVNKEKSTAFIHQLTGRNFWWLYSRYSRAKFFFLLLLKQK